MRHDNISRLIARLLLWLSLVLAQQATVIVGSDSQETEAEAATFNTAIREDDTNDCKFKVWYLEPCSTSDKTQIVHLILSRGSQGCQVAKHITTACEPSESNQRPFAPDETPLRELLTSQDHSSSALRSALKKEQSGFPEFMLPQNEEEDDDDNESAIRRAAAERILLKELAEFERAAARAGAAAALERARQLEEAAETVTAATVTADSMEDKKERILKNFINRQERAKLALLVKLLGVKKKESSTSEEEEEEREKEEENDNISEEEIITNKESTSKVEEEKEEQEEDGAQDANIASAEHVQEGVLNKVKEFLGMGDEETTTATVKPGSTVDPHKAEMERELAKVAAELRKIPVGDGRPLTLGSFISTPFPEMHVSNSNGRPSIPLEIKPIPPEQENPMTKDVLKAGGENKETENKSKSEEKSSSSSSESEEESDSKSKNEGMDQERQRQKERRRKKMEEIEEKLARAKKRILAAQKGESRDGGSSEKKKDSSPSSSSMEEDNEQEKIGEREKQLRGILDSSRRKVARNSTTTATATTTKKRDSTITTTRTSVTTSDEDMSGSGSGFDEDESSEEENTATTKSVPNKEKEGGIVGFFKNFFGFGNSAKQHKDVKSKAVKAEGSLRKAIVPKEEEDLNLLNRKIEEEEEEESVEEVSSDTVDKLRKRLAKLEEERAAIDADRMLLDSDLRDKWAERERKMDDMKSRGTESRNRAGAGDKWLLDDQVDRDTIWESDYYSRENKKKVRHSGEGGDGTSTKGNNGGGVKIINWLLHNLPGGRQTVIVI